MEKMNSNRLPIIYLSAFLNKGTTRESNIPMTIYRNISIYESDYSRLTPGNWLNDANIDFFIEFLIDLQQYRDNIYQTQIPSNLHTSNDKILSSYCFSSLDMYMYDRNVCDLNGPKQYFKGNDDKSILECYDRVFLVVNRANNHWVLFELSLTSSSSLKIDQVSLNASPKNRPIQFLNHQDIQAKLDIDEDNEKVGSNFVEEQFDKNDVNNEGKMKNEQSPIIEKISRTLNEKNTVNMNKKQTLIDKQPTEMPQLNELKQMDDNLIEYNNISETKKISQNNIRMRVFDSLGRCDSIDNSTDVILLKKFFINDFRDRYGQQVNFEVISVDAPRQQGGPDCGVFVCKFIQTLFYQNLEHFDEIQFQPAEMKDYRLLLQNIVDDISKSSSDYSKVFEKYLYLIK